MCDWGCVWAALLLVDRMLSWVKAPTPTWRGTVQAAYLIDKNASLQHDRDLRLGRALFILRTCTLRIRLYDATLPY